MDGRDVVGMARTGSGKTAAFVLPMIEKLKIHSAKVGARAIIMSPSRELAIQTLKVVKEMSKGSDLRTILLVGGDSLEDQFGTVMQNPDMYTPAEFLSQNCCNTRTILAFNRGNEFRFAFRPVRSL